MIADLKTLGRRSPLLHDLWGKIRWYASLSGLASIPGEIRQSWMRRHFKSATHVGRWLAVRGRPIIRNEGVLIIGDRFRATSWPAPIDLWSFPTGRIAIGDDVFMNAGAGIGSTVSVTIGNGCLIGVDVMIMDCDFHDPVTKTPTIEGAPIVIEDRVWLGNRSMVLKGVRIGHDSVVAAGAVVTRDVPPWTVVAGVPARPVRSLLPVHQVSK